eukprot:TRINITY_DN70566_c0_g1_i1.p1 TRINITY_DN70566_c0_g1~~TRINITY_DN70566_c0_g1_i1.p1  ORF type:complete len:547 (+),score=41.53 TRINITY_DN70566_c0_g1_i1:191-1831(+)
MEKVSFAVTPLRCVAAEVLLGVEEKSVEEVVILAYRTESSLPPYALPVRIPCRGSAEGLREKGLQLLLARTITVAAAVVGTASLKIVCEFEETFSRLVKDFERRPALTQHLSQYGNFELTRVDSSSIPQELRRLPFSHAHLVAETRTPALKASDNLLFLGVDYGRSDVKVAVLDKLGQQLSTHVTRWWRQGLGDPSTREYLDPAKLSSISEPLCCLGEAALDALTSAIRAIDCVAKEASFVLGGLGLSAAGCVRDGRLCGLPPAFGGCDLDASLSVLQRLEHALLEYIGGALLDKRCDTPELARLTLADNCVAFLVNDGDASALWGAPGLAEEEAPGVGGRAEPTGLFLSCGTGLAGGIARADGSRCGGCVLEMGKLVVGLALEHGTVPSHDVLGIEGMAQGMAGTQRSFFNLLEARGGVKLTEKAEQRAAIVAMQARALDDEVTEIFQTLGHWLAVFVQELTEYLPFTLTHVEVGGKLTDGASGEVMIRSANEELSGSHAGIQSVRRAEESEFGQAIAVAKHARMMVTCNQPVHERKGPQSGGYN